MKVGITELQERLEVLVHIGTTFVDRYTSHVTFSPAQRTCFMMCDTPYWLKCLHERVMSSTWSSTLCPEPLPPCGRRQGNYLLALRQLRSLAAWPKTYLSHLTHFLVLHVNKINSS